MHVVGGQKIDLCLQSVLGETLFLVADRCVVDRLGALVRKRCHLRLFFPYITVRDYSSHSKRAAASTMCRCAKPMPTYALPSSTAGSTHSAAHPARTTLCSAVIFVAFGMRQIDQWLFLVLHSQIVQTVFLVLPCQTAMPAKQSSGVVAHLSAMPAKQSSGTRWCQHLTSEPEQQRRSVVCCSVDSRPLL